MNKKMASGARFPGPMALIAAVLLLLPAFVHAKSEYRQCLEDQQRMGRAFAGYTVSRSFGAFPPTGYFRTGGYYSSGNYAGTGGFYSGGGSYISGFPMALSGGGWAEADRLSALARACRQYRKVNPPNFRIVAIKPHNLRPSVNGKR